MVIYVAPSFPCHRLFWMITYSRDQLLSYRFNTSCAPPPRSVWKTLFSFHLWLPASSRLCPLRSVTNPVSFRSAKPDPTKSLSIGLLNVRSLSSKHASLHIFCKDHNLDFFVLTETWHEASTDVPLRLAAPPGFVCHDAPRPRHGLKQRGGGVAVLHRTFWKSRKCLNDLSFSTFEFLCLHSVMGSPDLIILALNRPGSQPVTDFFFTELSSLLERLVTYKCPIFLLGDFNVHLENPTETHAIRFLDLVDSFCLVQHVGSPTHCAGGLLDLIISPSDFPAPAVSIMPSSVSDHFLVVACFPFPKSSPV